MGLEIKGLSVEYTNGDKKVHALENITFEIKDGESVGIAGESACGKSTLGLTIIRSLNGGNATAGYVYVDGEQILFMPEREFDSKYRWKKISMVFQAAASSLDPVFSVAAQFEQILDIHGFKGNKKKLVARSLESVGLESDILEKFPHELSGGMKQRVVIAMAAILKPSIIIVDEPTTALDVILQAQIVNLFKDLKKQNISILFITHDLAILSEIADKIGIMYAGQMVEFGNLQDIYENPLHPYTVGLLKSVPTLGGEKPKFISGTPPNLSNPPIGCRFANRCEYVMEKCSKDPLEFHTKSGFVKCWLYDPKK
ncbi:MAG: oligopeptide/dipeptide ABC transporter ATPase [Cenarchaeum symbiont of Oopsacas minuta]|nr:oligopeptide/dipeptide ABC transporter ATPase [Cenarchaeum symbiont of Oopsacas minuta]